MAFCIGHCKNTFTGSDRTDVWVVLEPIWREPLVLAMGMVSQLTYPLARRQKATLQQNALAMLLETPDPAGALLPRRELLAVAAVTECIQVPKGVAERIATRLLMLLK